MPHNNYYKLQDREKFQTEAEIKQWLNTQAKGNPYPINVENHYVDLIGSANLHKICKHIRSSLLHDEFLKISDFPKAQYYISVEGLDHLCSAIGTERAKKTRCCIQQVKKELAQKEPQPKSPCKETEALSGNKSTLSDSEAMYKWLNNAYAPVTPVSCTSNNGDLPDPKTYAHLLQVITGAIDHLYSKDNIPEEVKARLASAFVQSANLLPK